MGTAGKNRGCGGAGDRNRGHPELAIQTAIWRRIVWQIVVAGALLLLLTELSGAGRALAYWLKTSQPSAPEKRLAASVQVVVRPMPADAERPPGAISVEPSLAAPRPRQEFARWPGLAWAGGCALLTVWRLVQGAAFFRFRRRMRAVTDPDLEERVRHLARRFGIRRRVRLLESDRLAGPITFGLCDPVIGLPTPFARDFTRPQQDAMLAHELAHLAANDPLWQWVASLLVALLRWHPLAWWARRQLQTASEMAADEASLLVENGPDALAESLIALGRRLVERTAPGWLGVEGMGFRSGLGRRVERLMRLRGGCWSHANRWRARLARVGGVAGLLVLVVMVGAWIQPEQAARTFHQAWEQSGAGQALAAVVKPAASPRLAQADAKPASPSTPTRSPLDTTPVTSTNLFTPGSGRAVLLAKLERIVLPTVHFEDRPLGEVVQELAKLAKDRDPDRRGVNFILSKVEVLTNMPVSLAAAQSRTLREALDLVLASASTTLPSDLEWVVEDSGIVITSRGRTRLPLYTRMFRIDLVKFLEGMAGVTTNDLYLASGGYAKHGLGRSNPDDYFRASTNLPGKIKKRLEAFGVNLAPPKWILYNDRLGMVVVRATLGDLDAIEKVIKKLNPELQLVIEVKLCEVASADGEAIDLDQLLGETVDLDQLLGGGVTNYMRQAPEPGSINAALATATRILSSRQFRSAHRALEQRRGVDVLAAPKITTLSGRQAQIKVAEVIHVVTDSQGEPVSYLRHEAGTTNTPTGLRPLPEPVELGPMIDMVPRILADGRTIEMNVTASVREISWYEAEPALPKDVAPPDNPGSRGGVRVRGRQLKLRIGLQEARANLKVLDGQTLVLCGGSTLIEKQEKGHWVRRPWPQPATPAVTSAPQKHLLVFITPTIVDAAGNRVHTDEEFPERLRSVPPQQEPEGK